MNNIQEYGVCQEKSSTAFQIYLRFTQKLHGLKAIWSLAGFSESFIEELFAKADLTSRFHLPSMVEEVVSAKNFEKSSQFDLEKADYILQVARREHLNKL